MITGDETQDEVAAVIEAVTKILHILNETECPFSALQILSTATTFILCHGMTSAEEADESYNTFMQVTRQAITKAESKGVPVWTRGTYN